MLLLLIIFIQTNIAYSTELPDWITDSKLSDHHYDYVVCSSDGLDPEETKINAENKCLSDAAKINGVKVKVTQKTTQTLNGEYTSEISEIEPINANIKCEWTDRFLQLINNGYRVWLKCKVKKNNLILTDPASDNVSKSKILHKKFSITIILVPKADALIIDGEDGEKIINPKSNVFSLSFTEKDRHIFVKKNKYKTEKINIDDLNGLGSKTIVLRREP